MPQAFADKALPLPIPQHGILLQRREGDIYTNVPHLVTHHSPSGYAWGYGGSGPADLALNILEWVLRHAGYQGEIIRCSDGTCFRLAWQLHHDCTWQILARADDHAAQIPLETVTNWLDTSRQVLEPLQEKRP